MNDKNSDTKSKIDQLEKELFKFNKSNRFLLSAIDSAPIGIVTLTSKGDFVKVNKAFSKLIGYTEKELSSKNISEITHPDDIGIGKEVIKELTTGNKNKAYFEKRYVHKNGDSIYGQVSTVLIREERGNPYQFFTQVIDVTEQKKNIKKLIESEEQLKLITENTSDNIALTTFDLKAEYIYASPSTKYLTGWDVNDLIGKSFFDFIHPADKKALFPLLKKYVSQKVKNLLGGEEIPIAETIEFRFKNKAGDWIYMQSIVNIAGNQLLSVSRDITEYKRFEEKVWNSEEKYRFLTDNVPIGIYYNNLVGEFLYGNKQAEKIIGYKRDELIGKNFLKLKILTPKDIVKAGKILALNNLGKSTGPDIFTLNRKDGKKRDVEIFTEILTIDNEKVVLGMVQDITERKRSEMLLKESETRLKEAQRIAKIGSWELDLLNNVLY